MFVCFPKEISFFWDVRRWSRPCAAPLLFESGGWSVGFGGGGGEMDDDASMSIRWGGFFESPARNLGLQLMSSVPADRDTKQLLSGSPFLHHQHQQQHVPHHHHQPHHPRDCGANGNANGGAMPPPPAATEAPPSMPMNFVRNDIWMHPQQQHHHHPREPKVLHTLAIGHGGHIAHHDHPVGYGMMLPTHTL